MNKLSEKNEKLTYEYRCGPIFFNLLWLSPKRDTVDPVPRLVDKEKLYDLITSNNNPMIVGYMRDRLGDRIMDTKTVFISISEGVCEFWG